mmetsp:Transcript_30034/g.65031  ORF Transcript_30034/g.65031 Transcript_30034/m.65031 type:complete len:371 (+) Transcript_30034:66-1178(+)
MFIKIAGSIFVAALVAPCLYMCINEGRNEAAAAHHALMLRGVDPNDPTGFVRSWLKPYVATESNPSHKRAMVETLIRYGTTHVKRGVELEDVKDALAIEFLAQVDGKPVPIDGFDDALFIGTIGAAYNYNALKEAGITHIVSAARSARANFPEQIVYFDVNLSAEKATPEEIQDAFLKTSEFIHEATSRKDFKVMINDWEGAGRSAALILAHIMRSQQVTYDAAVEILMRTRPCLAIDDAYDKELLQLEQDLGLDVNKKTKRSGDHFQGADYYDYGNDLDDTDAFDSDMDDTEVDGFDAVGSQDGQEEYDDDDGSHFLGSDEDYDSFEEEYDEWDDDDDDDVNTFVYYEDDSEDNFIESGDVDISVTPKE